MQDEVKLADIYTKDVADEQFLQKLNSVLAPAQEDDYQDLPDRFPILFIVGAPRSGTTLLNQLIATHLSVGYINNLIAAFWRAPVYGIHLSKKLIAPELPSTYDSDFGRTRYIYEPHEFGYFWSTIFGNRSMMVQNEGQIDWERFRLILVNMTHAFGRPVVFKSPMLGFYMAAVQEWLPKACFVRVRRDPVHTAVSILKYRERFLGSVDEWVSIKPREYTWLKDEPYWKQVVGQVYYIEKAMTSQIDAIRGCNVLDISYEKLCRDPQVILDQIRALLNKNGGEIQQVSAPPTSFEFRVPNVDANPHANRVRQAIREFYG
jgi:LPS sulfotransferase NodH